MHLFYILHAKGTGSTGASFIKKEQSCLLPFLKRLVRVPDAAEVNPVSSSRPSDWTPQKVASTHETIQSPSSEEQVAIVPNGCCGGKHLSLPAAMATLACGRSIIGLRTIGGDQ
jgi:hypothetical protein